MVLNSSLLTQKRNENIVSDEFDDIVSGFNDGDEEPMDFTTQWDLIEDTHSKVFPGHLLIRGFIITESVDPRGIKVLRCQSSDGMQDWDIIGMLKYAIHRIEISSIADDYEFEDEDGEDFND